MESPCTPFNFNVGPIKNMLSAVEKQHGVNLTKRNVTEKSLDDGWMEFHQKQNEKRFRDLEPLVKERQQLEQGLEDVRLKLEDLDTEQRAILQKLDFCKGEAIRKNQELQAAFEVVKNREAQRFWCLRHENADRFGRETLRLHTEFTKFLVSPAHFTY